MKPGFFIIGERKCGTSSLYRYLCDHPRILPCKVKEPQFFSRSLLYRTLFRGRYDALFPPVEKHGDWVVEWIELVDDSTYRRVKIPFPRHPHKQEITGEASANTMCAVPPERLYRAFPEARLIAILREPTERAYSHYRMLQRFHAEGRKLPFKPGDFERDARHEMRNFHQGKQTYFIGPGVYMHNLKPWIERFGESRVQVVFAEHLAEPEKAKALLGELNRFLGVEPHDYSAVLEQKHNVSGSASIGGDIYNELREFYAPFDIELSEYLSRDIPWL